MIFDIETGPLPGEQLAKVKPIFVASRTLKDPEKIKADLEAKEASWIRDAALGAMTGQILAIGLLAVGPMCYFGDETFLLDRFWKAWEQGERMIGFSIKHFDLPFLFQRSLILGLRPPPSLWEGRYWNHRIIDLQERWCCYSNRTEGQSLDAVCKACGLPGKNGNGANFADLLATDPDAARGYLANDLEITAALAKRLGVI